MASKRTKMAPDWRGILANTSLVLAAVAFAALGHVELAQVALAAACGGAIIPTLGRRVPHEEDPS